MSTLSDKSNAEPNLVPILDMVFQLITFFMLVINFKSAALDKDLQLPVVGSAQPVNTEGRNDLLILNINEKGALRVYNRTIDDVREYIRGEATSSQLAAREENPEFKPGDDLPSTVVLRADAGTPFSLLNNVIVICQENGYRSFALRAMNKADKAKQDAAKKG